MSRFLSDSLFVLNRNLRKSITDQNICIILLNLREKVFF
ncbi:hypothetical protein NU08_2731 [Flavobacterium anhuiense]|uniref:Uncharacterized protein n=1 Tax=Flavobacterium anhuiense TaxID=459526 RepID=A0A444VX50_9FLAO|nr:hypothetical protein NU08_2731 [Flavobacterium anhuiense]